MQAKSRKKISAAVIAHNEEKNLPGLLKTLGFADEVVVLDAGSADATSDVARDGGARVLKGENLRNLNVNKTRAIEATTGDWIIYLDADERVPPALAASLLRCPGLISISGSTCVTAARIRIHNCGFSNAGKPGSPA